MAGLDRQALKGDYCSEDAVVMIGESNNVLACPQHSGSEDLLDRVRYASVRVDDARREYFTAITLAASRGYSNIQIANAARKTEAAVRMYLKRQGGRNR